MVDVESLISRRLEGKAAQDLLAELAAEDVEPRRILLDLKRDLRKLNYACLEVSLSGLCIRIKSDPDTLDAEAEALVDSYQRAFPELDFIFER